VAALILLAGAWLRLSNLDNNPPGLWQDEASTGLDAFLLWTTGHDRAGRLLPIIARSFGDYPLTLYRYLSAPIVGIFGLSIGTERMVAALGGTSLMISTFFWTRLALGDSKPAIGALMAGAFAPTWVHFSRYGSEAILLPATLTAAMALFELARVRSLRWPLYAGAVALGLSAHTYHAVKLFLPLWMIPFLWYQWPLITALARTHSKHVIGTVAVFTAIVLPSVIMAFTPDGMARGRTVAAWEHYKGAELVRVILSNYLGYFEPGMLFLHGGPAVAQSIPGVGLWNGIDLPLMVIGLVFMARHSKEHRLYGMVTAWLVLGPTPGAITYEAHNVGRVVGWLPAAQIISGLGAAAVFGWATDPARSKKPVPLLLMIALVSGWIITAATVFRLTLVRYPDITERDFQFEISRAIQCARDRSKGRHIVVSPAFQAADVFGTFHLSALPKSAWSIGTRSTVGENEVYALPADQDIPIGAPLCEIHTKHSTEVLARVYEALPAPAK